MFNRDQNKAIKRRNLSLPVSKPRPKLNRNQKLRAKARQMFFENVSLSGLLEFYYAPNKPIRWMWISALSICGVSILYHMTLLILAYKNQEPTYEFLQTEEKIIPFPKITVCSPTGINKTWAKEQIRFPPREKKMFDQLDQKKQEEFMDVMATLIFNDNNQFVLEKSFKPSSPNYFAYYHIILETYKQFPGGQSNFAKRGLMVPCEKMISNCQFAGIGYDCCKNVSLLVDDGGPCYDLRVDKRDKFWNCPRPSGSPISFTFDLLADWKHVLPYATINGYFIHIDNPFTMFGQPIAVQAGTHAMIDLSQPILKIDKSDCIDKGNTTMFGPYDSRGYLCKETRYTFEIIDTYLDCGFPYGAYFPNETRLCNGVWGLPLFMILAYGMEDYAKAGEQDHKKVLYDIVNSKTRCLPLCTRWEYSPRPSYNELINHDYLTPIGNNQSANISRSQVTIYMGSTYYMQQTEQNAQPFYKTFLFIADVTALYVGVSVITLAEIVFYGCNLFLVYRRTKGRRNRVTPF